MSELTKQSGHIFILTHASLFLWWEILPCFSNSTYLSTSTAKVLKFSFMKLTAEVESWTPCYLVVFAIKYVYILSHSTGENKRVNSGVTWMVYRWSCFERAFGQHWSVAFSINFWGYMVIGLLKGLLLLVFPFPDLDLKVCRSCCDLACSKQSTFDTRFPLTMHSA